MPSPDVIVVGGGFAGLTTALACADREMQVTLIAGARRGVASSASAGVLGPSVGRGPKSGRVGRFMFAARDRYPRFLDAVHARTGVRVAVVSGALEVALNATHLGELTTRATKLSGSVVLTAADVALAEPALVPVAGALHHPLDGAVDSAALLRALLLAVAATPRITAIDALAISIAGLADSEAVVAVTDGSQHTAANVVIAAGAWSAHIHGLPRAVPVRPVKGEIATARFDGAVRQVVFGAGGYLVPRGDDLLVGATSIEAGFDATPSDSAASELHLTAKTLLHQGLGAAATFIAQRAGLRPMTPDGYPILGRDPDAPSVIYACGYSRNGVLVSPLAAECVAALIEGTDPGFDLSAFAMSRFTG